MTTLGKYELHQELGRGGFAVVYRALDTRLNREVALKVLNASLSEDPRFVAQFRREAQSAANLAHPNIVVIHEADETNGRLFLAMQLLPGLDLRQRIDRDGPLPFPLVVSVIDQIAAALDYAHGLGFVHRDVKSANIILDESGHATLTDFGLVRAAEGSTYASSLSLSGSFIGTVEYMSPEQVEGQAATAKSDLYALGIVAYEMVTGRLPFKADTPLAVIRMQADKPAPDPRGLRPELPDGMRVAILKALAKMPDERPADVGAFARAMRAVWEATREPMANKPAPIAAGVTIATPSQTVSTGRREPIEAALTPDNPAGILWVDIPAGEFLYGENKERVHIRQPYQIGKFSVTNAQYQRFLMANPKQPPPGDWDSAARSCLPGKADHPVVNVSWEDAQAFCRWAKCRLPTEKEWEKAARGTDGRTYPWGEDWEAGRYCNSSEGRLDGTTAVDEFVKGVSPYGVWDLLGNVWEWTASKYDEEKYVVRGGAWLSYAHHVRAAGRSAGHPGVRLDSDGFRCVRSRSPGLGRILGF